MCYTRRRGKERGRRGKEGGRREEREGGREEGGRRGRGKEVGRRGKEGGRRGINRELCTEITDIISHKVTSSAKTIIIITADKEHSPNSNYNVTKTHTNEHF